MGLSDLFKSGKDREREEKKKRRKAFREAERAVDVVKGRAAKLKRESGEKLQEARQYLRDANQAASNRSLQAHRACEVMVTKLEMKRWVFEQLLTNLELAKTDQDFTQALSAVNTVIEINPDAVEDVLGEVTDKLGDQVDTDKIWEKAYGKQMEGVEGDLLDTIPSIEEMQKQLEGDVVGDMKATEQSQAASEGQGNGHLQEKIGDGQKRLKDLLGDDK
jgi:hypothetical protein